MSYQFGHVDRDERIEPVAEPEYEELQPRRYIPGVGLAVAVMAVFAGGLWFAYHEGTKHAGNVAEPGGVPLIRADGEPVKVRPDKAGGMDIPDKDNPLYSRTAGNTPVERLLPPPEQPAPRPAPPPPPPLPQAQAPTPAVQPPGPAPIAAPQPAPAPHRQVAAAPKAPPKPTPAPTAANGPRVQLGSLRTPEAAREEWTRLKREYPDLLGRLTAIAVRADLGAKGTYYRIEAGPLANKAAAARLCGELKQHRLGCSLVQ